MLRERMHVLKKLIFVADLCIIALAFQLSVIVSHLRTGARVDIFSGDHLILPAIIIWGAVFWFSPDCYSVRLRKIKDILISSSRAALISSGLFLAFIFAGGYLEEGRFQIVLFTALSAAFIGIFRLLITLLLEYYRSRGYNFQTVLMIGTGIIARNFVDKVVENSRFGLKVSGFVDWERQPHLWRYRDIPCIGDLHNLPELLMNGQIDWVVFAVEKKYLSKIEKSIEICEQMGMQIAVLADFFPMRLAQKRAYTFFDSPLVCYNSGPGQNLAIMTKGFLDRFLAAIGLILASPMMLAATVIVKLTSKGPAIFAQERCGLNGRKFKLYKFRTMVNNADELKRDLIKFNDVDGAAFKMKRDPRITPVGDFLRRTSIDELPQLFNVLRGDMSLVGPRPPLAEEVARFDLWQRRKLSMKPGLTCLWQINGRSDVSFSQWMKLDLEYIDNWSLWEDAKILARTVPAVFKGTGAR
jgi:exopolysaccharide biosynthesis polyprenyl glycosylphosphotransferase